jgi:hypothetical protein
MRSKPVVQNDRWCFPPAPSDLRPGDPNDRWCFPDSPPRAPTAERDEPWCLPERQAGDRGRPARRRVIPG